MIHLDNDSLEFSFPQFDRELSLKVREFSESRREAFCSSFRQLAGQKIQERRRALHERHSPDAALAADAALEHLASLGDHQIQEAWMEEWNEVAHGYQNRCSISFQRTLRLPDDGKVYPLPAGLGVFPLRSVDQYAATTPLHWLEKGGVLLPMYQAEALWLSFDSEVPLAIKITSGSVSALTGEPDRQGLVRKPQN